MKRKSNLILTIISAIFFGVGWFITSANSVIGLKLCISETDTGCLAHIIEGVGQPLFLGFACIFLISISFFFLRQEVFKTWSRFALLAIPLGAILITLTPTQGNGSFATPTIDREIITWFVSILFLLISLLIIAVKSYKLRN